jgi:flagellar motor switch/type III secretory pathway protein FliN
MSACRRWNEKPSAEKTWTHFKSHFAAAHHQHKQIQEETAAHAGFHSSNAAMTQTEDQRAEATIVDLENLATATASDRCVVAALTRANARIVKQLGETSLELRELRALHHQELRERPGPRNYNATANNYCWNHGYKVGSTHTSLTCNTHNPVHKAEATRADNMGGSQANKE